MPTPVQIVDDNNVNVFSIQHVNVTPVCDTSAYTGGDTLFDTTAISNASRANDAPVILQSITILDEDDQTAANMTLFFLDANVSLGTVNSAPNISDANARNIIGTYVMASGSFIDVGGSKVAHASNLNMVMKPASGTRTLYVAAMTAGTPTQTASGIKLRFGFLSG